MSSSACDMTPSVKAASGFIGDYLKLNTWPWARKLCNEVINLGIPAALHHLVEVIRMRLGSKSQVSCTNKWLKFPELQFLLQRLPSRSPCLWPHEKFYVIRWMRRKIWVLFSKGDSPTPSWEFDYMRPLPSWKGQHFLFSGKTSCCRYGTVFPLPVLLIKVPSVDLTQCFILCHCIPSIIACDPGSHLTKNKLWQLGLCSQNSLISYHASA